LPGMRSRADVVFRPARVAVFMDACFLHSCSELLEARHALCDRIRPTTPLCEVSHASLRSSCRLMALTAPSPRASHAGSKRGLRAARHSRTPPCVVRSARASGEGRDHEGSVVATPLSVSSSSANPLFTSFA
jgi:hypothetical protein